MHLPIEAKDHPCMSGGACQCGGSCGGGCGSKPAPSPLGSLDAYVVMGDSPASGGDGESYMSVQALQSMRDHAEDLLSRVDHGTRLPDWVEAKLTRAAQSLNDVYEYMSHGKGQRLAGLQDDLRVFNQQYPYHKDLDLIESRNRTLVGDGTFDIPGRRAGMLARAGVVEIFDGPFGKELEMTRKGRILLDQSRESFGLL
jgi:hypothetical protein